MSVLSRSSQSVSLQRAKQAIRNAALTQRQVAEQLGIDETKLSKALAGTRKFTPAEVQKFSKITGASIDWLTTTSEPAKNLPEYDRRDDVLRIAWQLFATHGYERVRVADIAEQAGVSPAAVMYHFKSKSAIFLACLEKVGAQTARSHAAILNGPNTPFTKLYDLTTTALPDTDDTRLQWAVWLQFWGSSPTHEDVKSATQASYDNWYAAIVRLVAQAQSAGWLPQDPLLAETLTALIDGLGIRIMSGVTTPQRARTILHEFYASRLIKPHPT